MNMMVMKKWCSAPLPTFCVWAGLCSFCSRKCDIRCRPQQTMGKTPPVWAQERCLAEKKQWFNIGLFLDALASLRAMIKIGLVTFFRLDNLGIHRDYEVIRIASKISTLSTMSAMSTMSMSTTSTMPTTFWDSNTYFRSQNNFETNLWTSIHY